jgi:hypothetical protein
MDIVLRTVAVTAVAARRRRDQVDLLIVADHPVRDATCRRSWPMFIVRHSRRAFRQRRLTASPHSAVAHCSRP